MSETGRPSKYSEEFIEKANEYLKECVDLEIPVRTIKGTHFKTKVNLPTVEGFALYLGVSKRVLYDWEKEYPEFLHALDKIRTEQQKRLLNMGLSGDYNPTIAKLILSSNHGMREKSDITTDGKELPTPLLANMDSNVLNNDSNKEDSEAKQEN